MEIDLQGYGLKTDPFTLQPTSNVTIWAGRATERELLKDIVRTPLASDIETSEFTVIHGDYGAGKSHSMRYLESMINSSLRGEFKSLAIYVPSIKMEQRTSFLRLYKEIIQTINMNELISLARKVRESFNLATNDILQHLPADQPAESIADYLKQEVFKSLDQTDVPMLKLLLSVADGKQEAIEYLQGNKKPPADTGLAISVDSDFAAAKTLGSLLRVLTLSIKGHEPACLATYLFLDEVEAILDDRQTDVQQFFQGIRNLVNELPYHFCLLLSFSADTALMEAVIPQAVLQRMTRQHYVELSSLTPDDAKDFIAELLAQHRPEGFTNPNRFHPFTEESIELAFERLAQITPRQLFRMLNAILIRAIRREGLAGGQEIDAGMAESILAVGHI